ncbi:MAG: metallophosphoesterase [Segetibacter sp.]
MRILHLFDFHYKSSAKDIAIQSILIDKLIETLRLQEKVDFILFTGDLVFSGSESTDFELSSDQLLKPIALV